MTYACRFTAAGPAVGDLAATCRLIAMIVYEGRDPRVAVVDVSQDDTYWNVTIAIIHLSSVQMPR